MPPARVHLAADLALAAGGHLHGALLASRRVSAGVGLELQRGLLAVDALRPLFG
eukprot:CAMPEP_0195074192 /NCGR_PEP_ID=MMETSP0448-20130528/17356_1 /TAXON_ID=66468 /ORGANISM="Heterocapsa triquestra, Strain CCMP 448" /LENGTH=53 /DNA_ID=CAMNT_0040106413 /DNA_START=60 /DNA_END=218 /DNA_ORIENTATION=-